MARLEVRRNMSEFAKGFIGTCLRGLNGKQLKLKI
jgi:hypothetical protein